jgi:hypothetical protein
METITPKTAPILEIAWMRYAQLDASSLRRTRAYKRLRVTIAVLGVLATLLSILITSVFTEEKSPEYFPVIRSLFIVIPIVASLLAAFGTRMFANSDWLITRAAAEEYLKEIYFFRTVLRGEPKRREYLEKRINKIQKQLFRGLGGEFAFRPFPGTIPPYYKPEYGNDPGFNDLNGDEYFKYRLEDQLRWHIKEVNEFKRERGTLTFLVLAAGGAGSYFAAWGGPLSVWVALTASITAAIVGWQQLRNVDAVIKNYSKVILELTTLYDHWNNLEPEERTEVEFFQMVRGCESVLWAQNTEYIKSMQDALKDQDLEQEASLVNQVIKESIESAERTKEVMREGLAEVTTQIVHEAEQRIEETFNAVVGSLAAEASSELVQRELEAMSSAFIDAAKKTMGQASTITFSLAQITQELGGVEVGRDTSKEELNAILARYPKTGEPKG